MLATGTNFNYSGSRARLALAFTLLLAAWQAHAAPWAEAFPPGAAFPVLEIRDQAGERHHTKEMAGEHGFVLFINRSAVW